MTERKESLRQKLAQVRERTLWLFEQVPDDMLRVRIDDFYSPIGWHFGHVGRTEEYWACVAGCGRGPIDPDLSFLLADTPENPKDNRVNIPDRAGIVAYLERTREAALHALDSSDLKGSPLVENGFAWDFAFQHECQHQETIVEMMMLIQKHRGDSSPWEDSAALHWNEPPETEWVQVQGREFSMGSDDPFGYDNERPSHRVQVADFELMQWPVNCFQWAQFIESGGYRDRKIWSDGGWRWRSANDIERPHYWLVDEAPATYSPFGKRYLLQDEPVTAISWYEAEAYCRWSGSRMPTEEEWEFVARGPRASTFPFGENAPTSRQATFALHSWRPATPSELPDGVNPLDIGALAGGVWEWTASPFLPYPGFQAFPYDGYSKDHMDGGHFVCRGGSFATQPIILRSSFRNWYVPTYRQGFLGLRCAR